MERKKILIVDDQNIMLDGLEALLAQEKDMFVCGRASTGKEAVDLAFALEPDVILMDISMPEMDGIEATRTIKKKRSAIQVLVLSMYNNPQFVNELFAAGACGYVLKNTDSNELRRAIHQAVAGQRYVAPAIQAALTTLAAGTSQEPDREQHRLTRREREVVGLILKELTNPQIAERLFLSQDTVETHRKNIMGKLGVHSAAGLVRYAMERGWAVDAVH